VTHEVTEVLRFDECFAGDPRGLDMTTSSHGYRLPSGGLIDRSEHSLSASIGKP
jgi:hypothetical protein